MAPIFKLIAIFAALAASGCSTLQKAVIVLQSVEGDGSATVESPASFSTLTIKNSRVEAGRHYFDSLDGTHKGKLSQTRIELHLAGSLPLLKGPMLFKGAEFADVKFDIDPETLRKLNELLSEIDDR